MNTIVVLRSQLLDKLKENRKTHKKDYEDAMSGYFETAKEKLEYLLDKVSVGVVVDFQRELRVPIPEDHSGEYDRAIRMLEWHVEEEIEVNEGEFAQYIDDDWHWKQSWTTSNVAYISKAREK